MSLYITDMWSNSTDPGYSGSNTKVINGQEVDSKIKSSLPNYRAMKQSGLLLPVLPYSRTVGIGAAVITLRAEQTEARSYPYSPAVNKMTSNNTFSSILAVPDFSTFELARRSVNNNNARAKFASHVNNMYIDGFATIGEGRETLKMVHDAVSLLRNLTFAFEKGNGTALQKLGNRLRRASEKGRSRVAKELTGQANDIFLQFNYGWKPLYYDLLAAVKLVKDRQSGADVYKKISGKYTDEFDIQGATTRFVPTACGQMTVDYEANTHVKIESWFGGILTSEFLNERTTLQRELGLTLDNVIPGIWELTRASFLIDYWLNVGDVLSNIKGAPTKTVDSTQYHTEKITLTTNLKYASHAVNQPGFQGVFYTGSVSTAKLIQQSIVFFNRKPASDANMLVSLNFTPPSMAQVGKSLSVVTSMLGLLRSKR